MGEPSDGSLQIAVKALSRRELTRTELVARLVRSGVEPGEAEAVVARLRETGYQSDTRAAIERARVLASRPLGDAAIAADLRRRGIGREEVAAVLADLEPEVDRAQPLAERHGPGPALARALSSKGFSYDTVEALQERAVADGR